MQESLLHYIWQFQYYDKHELQTTTGEQVIVFHPGFRNTHAGPDFSNARIKIGDLEWVGSVEIHIHASGWKDHHHDRDAAYDNVVLHVVWKDDAAVKRNDNSSLPTVELQKRVSEDLLLRYNSIHLNPESIPCSGSIPQVSPLIKLDMVEKALMTRLENKSKWIRQLYYQQNNDWDETFYQMLSRNFGFKVNAEPFLMLAKALPHKIIMKHADKQVQIEALLFGQAGLLEEKPIDDYYGILQREYKLLSRKFTLAPAQMNKAQWRFLRLRPANFPTIRLAQLAAMLTDQRNIFSRTMECNTYNELANLLSCEQSDYWRSHYLFGKQIDEDVPALGKASVDNIIINTIVPFMVAVGHERDDQHYVDKALNILQQTQAEENMIVKQWRQLGMKPKHAFDSQALIELHNNFCLRRKCLECSIGASLIRPVSV